MNEFVSTKKLAEAGTYYSNAQEFFGNFPAAWDGVRCQVLKLETRQSYQEPNNESYRALEPQGVIITETLEEGSSSGGRGPSLNTARPAPWQPMVELEVTFSRPQVLIEGKWVITDSNGTIVDAAHSCAT